MQLPPLYRFLSQLARNNDRAWFQENKATYDQLRAQFVADAEFLARGLAQLDPVLAGPQGRTSVFRIYRDVRFSKNKTPYKTHFSVYFTASLGKEVDSPGYYLQLGPHGQTLVAGGLYLPDKAQLAAVRQEIDYNGDQLKALLAAPDFRRLFGPLGGDKLQRGPAGYPADHPDLELLKHKSFVAAHEIPDHEALALPDWRAHALEGFRALVPLCRFLREAVEGVKS
jgi:uncharacterized protein (TIGR02453 family)